MFGTPTGVVNGTMTYAYLCEEFISVAGSNATVFDTADCASPAGYTVRGAPAVV